MNDKEEPTADETLQFSDPEAEIPEDMRVEDPTIISAVAKKLAIDMHSESPGLSLRVLRGEFTGNPGALKKAMQEAHLRGFAERARNGDYDEV